MTSLKLPGRRRLLVGNKKPAGLGGQYTQECVELQKASISQNAKNFLLLEIFSFVLGKKRKKD